MVIQPRWLGKYSTMASEILRAEAPLKLKTKVFELGNGRYRNLSELAQAMGMSAKPDLPGQAG